MRPLLWLRADLRIRDNTALFESSRAATRGLVAVYLLAPAQWLEHDWAPVKVDLILRTLRELSAALAARNIPLLIRTAPRFADAPAALIALAKAHRCDRLDFNREYELNESRRDEEVTRTFRAAGIPVHAHHDQTLLPPGSVRTRQDRPYTVFTPFRRACESRLAEEGLPAVNGLPRKQPGMAAAPDLAPAPGPIRSPAPSRGAARKESPGASTPGQPIVCTLSPGRATLDSLIAPLPPALRGLSRPDLWPPGESEAAKRLERFTRNRLPRYHLDRDRPDLAGTSTLSPYLTIGAISIRQCLHAAADANNGRIAPRSEKPPDGPSTWTSELLWREFYKHLLAAFPRLCMNRPFKRATDRLPWRDDPAALDAWERGRTGYPIVDAGMRQLAQTGWMHNRLRMVTAMFLTKDLLIDWRRGERHFMRTLVDGDLAQNNGGWQWSASTGTDSVPYFRVFNPAGQSRKFDPRGAFIRAFIPELAHVDSRAIHDPPPRTRAACAYPAAIVDHAQARRRALDAFANL
jgi:deoxyribodipyrimidine photo-lyase